MGHRKKLAVLASRFPYPLNKGDKLRLYHQIKYLAQFFEIHLYAINEEQLPHEEQTIVRKMCASVTLYDLNIFQKAFGIGRSLIKREPIQVGYFYSKVIETSIEKDLKKRKIDAVYCQLSRTAPYGLVFKGPVIFDYQDCFSKNYERAYNNSKGIKKWFYKREWISMLHYEDKIHHDFIAKTIISSFDRDSLPFDASKISVIPNGVDPDYYCERKVEKRFDILFSGNLNYQPNIDAALSIIDKLYPQLKECIPNIKIGIAGNTRNQKILDADNENIFIISDVLDMRDMYAATEIYVAPLFTGAGLQNKLLEAMSMAIPCIATNVSNQSLGAKHLHEIIEVSNTDELTNAIIRLLKDAPLRKKIAQNGQQYVHQNYSWEAANEKLYSIINRLL